MEGSRRRASEEYYGMVYAICRLYRSAPLTERAYVFSIPHINGARRVASCILSAVFGCLRKPLSIMRPLLEPWLAVDVTPQSNQDFAIRLL